MALTDRANPKAEATIHQLHPPPTGLNGSGEKCMSESLRVGVVGPTQIDEFAWNIASGLEALGHVPVLVGPLAPSPGTTRMGKVLSTMGLAAAKSQQARELMHRKLRANLLDDHLDLVITVASLPPELVREIRKAGIPVALWFPDAVTNLGPMWMFDAPYSATFFKEPVLVRRLRALQGLRIHYLPEACNPEIHRPSSHPETTDALIVAGNYYSTRTRLLERLHADGVPLRLFGSPLSKTDATGPLGALHTGRYVRGPATAAVFSGAAAVLNNLHPAEIDGVNCRLFEAAACGSVVLTEYRRCLPDLFEIGTEVLTFSTYDELVTLAQALAHGELDTQSVRSRASSRAHGQHSYSQRLDQMLKTIE